jgi:hypothetical protein
MRRLGCRRRAGSFGLYNTKDEVDVLVEGVERVIEVSSDVRSQRGDAEVRLEVLRFGRGGPEGRGGRDDHSSPAKSGEGPEVRA